MGVSALDSLCAGLLQALPASTPAAMVQHASLPQQRHLVCTLNELASEVNAQGIGSPAIIVVGDVLHGLQNLTAKAVDALAA